MYLLLLSVLALVWDAFLCFILLIGAFNARKRRHSAFPPAPPPLPNPAPGVSILRPLKGLDPNLYENLESTFTQRYPVSSIQLIFSIKDPDDPAVPVVQDLQRKYPNVDATIIIGDEPIGVNPKINNLLRPLRASKHPYIWVLDSNILVPPTTLPTSISTFLSNPTIGLVHHVPYSSLPTDAWLGSSIEHAFLTTTHAKMYLALNYLAVDSCVVGKSNIFRKEDVARLYLPANPRITGLEAFSQCLAEDNMIASRIMHQLHLAHSIPPTNDSIVYYYLPQQMSLSSYISRRLRWIRVRKHMVLTATFLEPFTESILSGLLTSLALSYLLSIPPLLAFTIHTLLWLALDLQIYTSLNPSTTFPPNILQFLKAWCLRELLTFPIWAVAVWGNRVEWRGEVYAMKWNGEAVRVEKAEAGRGWFATRRRGYEAVESLESR